MRDNYISDDTIEQTRKVLDHPELGQKMAEHNYGLAQAHYSYSVLNRQLTDLFESIPGRMKSPF